MNWETLSCPEDGEASRSTDDGQLLSRGDARMLTMSHLLAHPIQSSMQSLKLASLNKHHHFSLMHIEKSQSHKTEPPISPQIHSLK